MTAHRRGSWKSSIVGLAAAALTTALGASCTDGPGGGGQGTGEGSQLDGAERDGLVFVREEEKLARDVYAALEAHDPAFVNIGDSEQTHMDAVGTLLERYEVDDPAAGRDPGEFMRDDLRALHDVLVERGSASRLDALGVGVEIEELDIVDIEALLPDVGHQDVENVYGNLLRGSRNHLRTFHGALVAAGGTYSPSHLDPDRFEAIVSSPPERGP